MTHSEKRCCVEPGRYTLTCFNTKSPHGWKGGFIAIDGIHYCDDFMGFKAMRRITIDGESTCLLITKVKMDILQNFGSYKGYITQQNFLFILGSSKIPLWIEGSNVETMNVTTLGKFLMTFKPIYTNIFKNKVYHSSLVLYILSKYFQRLLVRG